MLGNQRPWETTVDAAQVRLVQDSFQQVVPIQAAAGQLFYQRLFELDPSLRSLFKDDLTDQVRALMAMLSTAVFGLSRLDEIVPVVQALGRRHANYGVQEAHYATVGQ